MRLINKTDIESDYLREVIQFVKPNSISKFDVLVSFGSKIHGNAISEHYIVAKKTGEVLSDLKAALARIYISKGSPLPYIRDSNQNRQHDKGYLPILLLDIEEELYYLMAHELRHLWQYKHQYSKRGWYPNNPYRWGSQQSMEYDACCYGRTIVRKFRRSLLSFKHRIDLLDRIDSLPFLFPAVTETAKRVYVESKPMIAVAAEHTPRPKPKTSDGAPESYKVQRLVTFFHCLRCGKEWIPRFSNKEPTVCKFCKNPYWNKPREK